MRASSCFEKPGTAQTMQPRVSIGMPAYNAASTVRVAIESLLAQTLGDFELIVSDNASTDETRAVVAELAARDTRISYQRQPVNIGANPNYTSVFHRARGEFFKWASSSDWCAPTLLERCVAALSADPDAVLAAPRTRLFVGDPSHFQDYASDFEILERTPSQRLARFLATLRLNNAMNGVFRAQALRATRLVEPYQSADVVMMGHLALLGKMLLVDEPLYYRRMEQLTSTALQSAEAVRQHHYPSMHAGALFQASKRHLGWLRAASAAPLPAGEALRVYRQLLRLAVGERQGLFDDIRGAVRYAFGALGGRTASTR